MVERRKLLCGLGSIGVAGLAGCIDSLPLFESEEEIQIPDSLTNDDLPDGLSTDRIEADNILTKTPLIRREVDSLTYEMSVNNRMVTKDVYAQLDFETEYYLFHTEKEGEKIKEYYDDVNDVVYVNESDGDSSQTTEEDIESYTFTRQSDSEYSRFEFLLEIADFKMVGVENQSEEDNELYVYETDRFNEESDTSLPYPEFQEFQARIKFDEMGNIMEIEVNSIETSGEEYELHIVYSDYGETTVEPPDWV